MLRDGQEGGEQVGIGLRSERDCGLCEELVAQRRRLKGLEAWVTGYNVIVAALCGGWVGLEME